MLLIQRYQTNPYFNIAAEEYVLKHFTEDVFMLWQNEPSVIIGKHQNTMAEINHKYVEQNAIPVVRRISGGGAVFHDLGNLNFTFVKTIQGEDLVDFKRFIDPIIAVLRELGIDARHEGHNDIRINGLKCSGNAEHVFKNRVLHHGTILFSSDLQSLGKALHADEERFTGRAVKSRRSPVTNIVSHLREEITLTAFIDKVYNHLYSTNQFSHYYHFTDHDQTEIQKLADQKYMTWEWNWGYSPAYQYRHQIKDITCELETNGGIITQASIVDTQSLKHFTELEKVLIGARHQKAVIQKIISELNLPNNQFTMNEYLSLFF